MDPGIETVAPKVVLKEAPSAATTTATEQMVRKMGEEIAKGNYKEAIEAAKNNKPIDAGKISRKADEIGTERDPSTGLKTRATGTEEEKRFKDFKESAELNKKLIEQGYDRLLPAEQDQLRSVIQGEIISNPALLSEFSSLSATEQENRIRLIIKDPKYISSLREAMGRALEKEVTIKDQEILDREDEVADRASKKLEAETAKTDLDRQIAEINTALKEFDRSPTSPGLKATELTTLLKGIAATQTELLTWKTTLRDAEAELADLQSDKQIMLRTKTDITVKENEIVAKKTEIRNARAEVDSRQGKLDRVKELQAEEAALKEKKTGLEKSRGSKDRELKAADLELSKSNRRLDDLKRVRADQEDDLVNGMRNASSEAANKYFIKQLEVAEIAYNKVSGEEGKKYTSADERAVQAAKRKRWERVENPGTRKEKILICKDKVNADFLSLIKDGGSDNILREMLRDQVNERTKVNYTDADIDTLFADKLEGSFYNKMSQDIILQTVRRKILAGGITPADVFNIQASKWGEGMVKKSLEANKAAAAEMEMLTGEKMINNSGFMPRLWEQTKKRPWLLATLLGIVAFPILAAKKGTAQTASFIK